MIFLNQFRRISPDYLKMAENIKMNGFHENSFMEFLKSQITKLKFQINLKTQGTKSKTCFPPFLKGVRGIFWRYNTRNFLPRLDCQ